MQCSCGTTGLLWQSVQPQLCSDPSPVPLCLQGFLQLLAVPCIGEKPNPQLSALCLSMRLMAACLELEDEEGCMGLGCTGRCLWVLCPVRHLLNVTWEHRDFSFNEGGYLVRPTMVVITLNQHRLWEMVGPLTAQDGHTLGMAGQGKLGAMHRIRCHSRAGCPMVIPKPITGTKGPHGGTAGFCSNAGHHSSANN